MRDNPSISRLDMKLCFVNDVGAAELLEMIQDGEGAHRLTELDLSNNMLTFPMCQQLLLAQPDGLKLTLTRAPPLPLTVPPALTSSLQVSSLCSKATTCSTRCSTPRRTSSA